MDYLPNSNSQQRSNPDAHIPHWQAGDGQGDEGFNDLGKDQPWMPWGQSEQTSLRWQPRLWDTYPAKCLKLRHCQAHSQNKGLNRTNWLWTGAYPSETSRGEQPKPERGSYSPREASYTELEADLVANQDFFGFWTVYIHQEGHSQRSAPQKRDTAHLRRCACFTPRKLSVWDRRGDKLKPSTGDDWACQAAGHLSCSDLEWAQNTGPTKSVPLWRTWEPEPEWLRPG